MQQWAYMRNVVPDPINNLQEHVVVMAAYGDEGWEMVGIIHIQYPSLSIYQGPGSYLAFFKRPKGLKPNETDPT